VTSLAFSVDVDHAVPPEAGEKRRAHAPGSRSSVAGSAVMTRRMCAGGALQKLQKGTPRGFLQFLQFALGRSCHQGLRVHGVDNSRPARGFNLRFEYMLVVDEHPQAGDDNIPIGQL
jgi:hypothetical protein